MFERGKAEGIGKVGRRAFASYRWRNRGGTAEYNTFHSTRGNRIHPPERLTQRPARTCGVYRGDV
jgi:hypothetical protein